MGIGHAIAMVKLVKEAGKMASREQKLPPGLDPGIVAAVETLINAGIETFESCEGGKGHSYPEPTVRFYGERPEGMKALSAALYDGRLEVKALRRVWPVQDGEPVGPWWELVFRPTMDPHD